MSGIDIKQYASAKKSSKASTSSGNESSWLNTEISFGGNKLKDAQKEMLYTELHVLFAAGLDIKSALDLMEAEQEKKKVREVIHTIKEDVIGGKALYESMRDTGQFTPFEYFSIKIGEETGRINQILEDLAAFYNNKIKQRRQLVSAFSYPAIVSLTAFGAVGFMLNFIVPIFTDVFKRFGDAELPYITQLTMDASDAFQAYIGYVFIVVIASVLSLRTQRQKEWFRHSNSSFQSKLPVIGEMMQKAHLARFSHIMALLSAAKLPMLQTVDLVQQMIGYYPIEKSLEQVKKDIMNGKHLHTSLSAFPIYPKRMLALIKVGEEVNQLEQVFARLSKQFSDEVDHKSSIMSSLLEPFLILFLALVVGTILVALYLPIFELGGSFGG